jgi:DNA-binding NtrC family response regulator
VDIKGRILVVAEEIDSHAALVELLRAQGHSVVGTAGGFKMTGKLGKLGELAPDLIITDLEVSGTDGVALLRMAHEQDADMAVVVVTPPSTTSAASPSEAGIDALRAGARAYLAKPVNAVELSLVVQRELAHRRLCAEAGQLRARLAERYRFENMIGSSAPMQAVFKTVSQVATARASVLLCGESGTGKELIAAAIHEKSPRAKGPFVKLKCAALAEGLLESELFGHERGDFTDAPARREGRLVQADGGTLFLDEIDAVSPAIQVKLLRFLQEHRFERGAAGETVGADVRLIAATSRDLHPMIVDGTFREDLFYRLNVINVEVPALRDRLSDVPLLAMHFIGKYAAENNKNVSGLSDDALERLCAYAWPGNVRELENVIERAVVLCVGARIGVAELPPHLQSARAGSAVQIPGSTLDSIERYAITKTLEATEGSTSRAAEILGISIRKVQYKLHEYQATPRPAYEAPIPTVKRN